MSHSLNRIWVHAIWSTKDKTPFLTKDIRKILIPHLIGKYKEMKCDIRIINGIEDHLHSLFLANSKRSISEIIKNIKGESSRWLNLKELFNETFSWQVGYAAFSVSESLTHKIYKYIKNQQEHHQEITFNDELNILSKSHDRTVIKIKESED